MKTNELLNEVAAILNTTDKNLVLSATLKSLIAIGMTGKEAWETLFGQGSYNELAGALYERLNEKSRHCAYSDPGDTCPDDEDAEQSRYYDAARPDDEIIAEMKLDEPEPEQIPF